MDLETMPLNMIPKYIPILLLCLALLPMKAFSAQAPTHLQVSENQHYVVDENGDPFFWLGDTAWELFHRLDLEEAEHYLSVRAEQGFNLVQAVVLAEQQGLTVPNAYGDLPLIDLDPTRPNEAYFEHVDRIVKAANSRGIVVGMLPTWGDKFNKKWGAGPEVFTPQNAETFGRFLGKRYKDASIVWILGGDRIPEKEEDFAIIEAMAKGLSEGDGGKHLTTLLKLLPQSGLARHQHASIRSRRPGLHQLQRHVFRLPTAPRQALLGR